MTWFQLHAFHPGRVSGKKTWLAWVGNGKSWPSDWQSQDTLAASTAKIHQVKSGRMITSSVEQEWVLLFVKQKYSEVSITQLSVILQGLTFSLFP